MLADESRHIIIFDGVCKFCNGAVNFIIRRDPNNVFCFTPMQSTVGQRLMSEFGVNTDNVETFLLVKNGVSFEKSDAALEIVRDLSGPWFLLRVFLILPRPLRDFFYDRIATNRYTLFGRFDECLVPSPEVRNRFIDDPVALAAARSRNLD